MSQDAPISCWISDDCVWVRVSGRASYQNSPRVKEFCRDAIQRGLRCVMVDMEECSEIDSTFMGILAGVALRLREIGKGSVRLLNIHPEHAKLFRALGLDMLMEI